ncbi:hypothetical protein [Tenacibaculum sp. L6]|uniref:hypothetical protein n=1 Tax=Tenacibaculum sp. L6 TaxID=2992764 RepID=UPI00237AD5FD|nr:hypothetical protein [Tenacibaculum sp. L6]MDE0535741.1 hypothetical protein [Tenacibaculum sp. L6]
MELTKEQIQEIDNYISACGIKFYDVKAELVDHFASILEERLEKEPELDIKKAIIEEHKKFSDQGFKNLLKTKTDTVHKRFYKLTFLHLKSFFKLPKLIITIAIFYLFKELMNLFENKEHFFNLLSGIGLFIIAQLFIRVTTNIGSKKDKFLVLNKSDMFLNLINSLFIFFNSSVTFRSDQSFTNNNYNLIHLGAFVLLLLFYWSGEYVFYQNKQTIKKQYPNVLV